MLAKYLWKIETQRNVANFMVSEFTFQVAFHWFLAVNTTFQKAVSSVDVCQRFIVPFWQGNNSCIQTTWNLKVCVSCKNLQRSICDIFLRCFHSRWNVFTPWAILSKQIQTWLDSSQSFVCFVLFWPSDFALGNWPKIQWK